MMSSHERRSQQRQRRQQQQHHSEMPKHNNDDGDDVLNDTEVIRLISLLYKNEQENKPPMKTMQLLWELFRSKGRFEVLERAAKYGLITRKSQHPYGLRIKVVSLTPYGRDITRVASLSPEVVKDVLLKHIRSNS